MNTLGKRKYSFLLGAVLGLSVLSTTPSFAYAANVQQEPNEELVQAISWMQTSAEYRELCYQAYNAASAEIDKVLATHRKSEKPLAIILDCDETIIGNTALMAGAVDTARDYNLDWDAWEVAGKAAAMPGAVEFLQSVDRKGVQIFYVSNRSAARSCKESSDNLRVLGFPQIEPDHMLFKVDTGDKKARFRSITDRYDVILYLGDSTTDLPLDAHGKDAATRRQIVDEHKNEFGSKYIVLPNPVYGSWMSSLDKDYWNLTPEQRSRVHKAALTKWRAEQENQSKE